MAEELSISSSIEPQENVESNTTQEVTQAPQQIDQVEQVQQEQTPTDQGDPEKAKKLYGNLLKYGFGESELGTQDEFINAISKKESATNIYNSLINAGFTNEELGDENEFLNTFVELDTKQVEAKKYNGEIIPSEDLPTSFVVSTSKNNPFTLISKINESKQKLEANPNDIDAKNELTTASNKLKSMHNMGDVEQDFFALMLSGLPPSEERRKLYQLNEEDPKGELVPYLGDTDESLYKTYREDPLYFIYSVNNAKLTGILRRYDKKANNKFSGQSSLYNRYHYKEQGKDNLYLNAQEELKAANEQRNIILRSEGLKNEPYWKDKALRYYYLSREGYINRTLNTPEKADQYLTTKIQKYENKEDNDELANLRYLATEGSSINDFPLDKIEKFVDEKNPYDVKAFEVYKQNRLENEKQYAIDITTERALKNKGITAAKGTPSYMSERLKIEQAVKDGNAVIITNPETGKPDLAQGLGFWDSMVKGWSDAIQSNDDAYNFDEMTTQEKIDFANKRMNQAITKEGYYGQAPSGMAGEAGEIIGGAAPLVGKTVAGATAGAALVAATPVTGGVSLAGVPVVLGFAAGVGDMVHQGSMNKQLQSFYELKQKYPGKSDKELMIEAEKQGVIGAAEGGATHLAFTLVGGSPMQNAISKNIISNESKNLLTKTIYKVGKASVETIKSGVKMATIVPAVQTASSLVTNITDPNLKKDASKIWDEAVHSAASNFTAGGLLHLASMSVEGAVKLPVTVNNVLKHAIVTEYKGNPGEVEMILRGNEKIGNLKPGTAQELINQLNQYEHSLSQVPEATQKSNPEIAATIAGLIDKKNNLLKEMSKVDSTQTDSYQKQIDAVDERIKRINETGKPLEEDFNSVGQPLEAPSVNKLVKNVNLDNPEVYKKYTELLNLVPEDIFRKSKNGLNAIADTYEKYKTEGVNPEFISKVENMIGKVSELPQVKEGETEIKTSQVKKGEKVYRIEYIDNETSKVSYKHFPSEAEGNKWFAENKPGEFIFGTYEKGEELPQVKEGEKVYRVEYTDPKTGERTSKLFINAEEGKKFQDFIADPKNEWNAPRETNAYYEKYDGTTKLETYDTENITGIPSKVGVGEKPIEAKPVEGGGAQEISDYRDIQKESEGVKEAQIADIERRRKEELDSVDKNILKKKIKSLSKYKELFPQVENDSQFEASLTTLHDMGDKLGLSDEENKLVSNYIYGDKGKINAKYDAELAALELPKTEKEAQVSGEVPKEAEVTSNADYNIINRGLVKKLGDAMNKRNRLTEGTAEYKIAQDEVERADKELLDFQAKNKDLILEHGTPHDFEKFELEKIGTGEGNQAFGWGLYFTESSKIAKQYADRLSNDKDGNIYKVSIKDGRVKDWLNWRDALDDTQAEKIAKVIADKKSEYEKYLSETKSEKPHTGAAEQLFNEDLAVDERPMQAGAVYSDLADAFGQKEATRIMVESGIDGVKYKSKGGRGEEYNYVVFNPESIKITEKTKLYERERAGAEAGGAVQAVSGVPEEQKAKEGLQPSTTGISKREAEATPAVLEQEQTRETDMLMSGEAEKRRKEGGFVKDGIEYKRNEKGIGVASEKGGEVRFTSEPGGGGVVVPFKYKLVEAEDLQPSHQDGIRNPLHFIPEAQPKNRNDIGTLQAEESFANNPRFNEMGENTNAYSGAPVVNERGEVIQGNNRSAGLRKGYQRGNKTYRNALAENAEQFGFTKEQVDGMKNPVLVREVAASDQGAIELGNYDVKDLETGGKRRLDPVAITRRMPFSIKGKISDILFKGEETLNQAIRSNIKRVMEYLDPYLNQSQRNTIFKNNELTDAGIKDLESVVQQFLFDGGDVALPELYENLSHTQKEGLRKALPYIFSTSAEKSITPEIQEAILALNDFGASKTGNFDAWLAQSDMFNNGMTPREKYSPTAIKIAEILETSKSQKEISSQFGQYAESVNDKPATMFEEAQKGVSKKEGIKQIFKTEYDESQKPSVSERGGEKTPIEEKPEVRGVLEPAEKPAEPAVAEPAKPIEPAESGRVEEKGKEEPKPRGKKPGKYESRAIKIAEDIMKLELPDWMKAEGAEGIKKAGASGEELKKALADAVVTMGKLIDKGVEFSQAVKIAVKDLIKAQGEEYREQIEKGFEKYYNEKVGEEMKKGVVEEPKEPFEVGVSHERLNKLAEKVELPKIPRKAVLTPEEYADRGRLLIKGGADPIEIAKEFEKDGLISSDRISIVRAHLESLVKNADELGKKYGYDSQQYKDAIKEVDDWMRNTVKPMGSQFGESGRSLQGGRDLETDSFTYVKKQVEEKTGVPTTKEQDKRIKELTDTNQKLKQKVSDIEKKLVELSNKVFGEKPEVEIKEEKQVQPKETPKPKEARDFKAEREVLKNKLKDALEKYKANMRKLGISAEDKGFEISVDMAKIVLDIAKSHVEEVGAKLSDVTKRTFEDIKDIFEGITERNIKDIIAGKYIEKGHKEISKATKDFRQIQSEAKKMSLEDLQEMFLNKTDNKFSMQEASDIWEYAKREYLDKGVNYRDMLSRVADDLGLTWRQVIEAITSPKQVKEISNEMWKKRSDLLKNQNATKRWIDDQNKSAVYKAVRKLSDAFRGSAVFGHGGVFVGTHAGMNLFSPSRLNKVIPAFFNAYKFAYGNKAAYEIAMEELKNRQNYTLAQRAGLKNNPDAYNIEEYQKYQTALGKLGMVGQKGFNALKVLRQDLFDAEFNKLTDAEKADPKVAERVSELINLATGATNLKIPEAINELTFAGGMEVARWGKLTKSPIKATETAIRAILKPETASTADKVFAKIWARRVGEQLGTFTTMLLVNAAIQNYFFPKNKVNIANPQDPDWLRFKFGVASVDPTSGMLQPVNFVKGIGDIATKEQKELKGRTRLSKMGELGIKYVRGKLSPFYGTAVEQLARTDYKGNVLPYFSDKPTTGKHKLTYLEYALSKAPLPIAEAMGEMYNAAAENDADRPTTNQVFEGILSGVLAGTTGFKVKVGETKKLEEKTFTIYQERGNKKREATQEELTKSEESATKRYNEALEELSKNRRGIYGRDEHGRAIKWGYNKYGNITIDKNDIKKDGDYSKLDEDQKEDLHNRIKSQITRQERAKIKY